MVNHRSSLYCGTKGGKREKGVKLELTDYNNKVLFIRAINVTIVRTV